jgi:tetratricopeptide (TPR) repeat protein
MITFKKKLCIVFIVLPLIIFVAIKSQTADKVSMGQQAENAGDLQQALTHYIEALKADENNHQLREKIIKLARKMQPSPSIPEEAERRMLRGEAAVEIATDRSGFEKAAKEFQAALLMAPWLSNGYFNLSLVQEKAGDYLNAIRNARYYLMASPDASDSNEVRKRIIKLEYKQEQSKAEKRIEKDQEKRENPGVLAGTWRVRSWTYPETMPSSIDSKHWGGIAKNETVTITLNGDTINAEYNTPGFSATYKGIISGNKITGQKTNTYSSLTRLCPPVRFEGTIDYNQMKIIFATHGTYWVQERSNSCRYDSNSHYGSIMLVR